jgi:hypothetical protein
MPLTPEEILVELRALPAAERLRVVERVVREVAEEVTPVPGPVDASEGPFDASDAIWADESDGEFEAFQRAIKQLRAADVWRTDDGQEPR